MNARQKKKIPPKAMHDDIKFSSNTAGRVDSLANYYYYYYYYYYYNDVMLITRNKKQTKMQAS